MIHAACAYPVRDVVGDVCEDVFGCVHAVQHLVHTQHIIDGFPLRQDGGHLQPLLGLFHGNLCRLGNKQKHPDEWTVDSERVYLKTQHYYCR